MARIIPRRIRWTAGRSLRGTSRVRGTPFLGERFLYEVSAVALVTFAGIAGLSVAAPRTPASRMGRTAQRAKAPVPRGTIPEAAAADLDDRALIRARECLDRADPTCAAQALTAVRDSALKKSPNYLELQARTLTLEGRKQEALSAIERAIQKDRQQARYLITRGQIYQKFDDQPSAIHSFLLAQRLQPRWATIFYSLGMSFFILNGYDRAERHFKLALELDPHDDKAEFMLGVVDVVNFRLADAKPHLEKALEMQPRNPYYHLHYGILLSRLGDQARALKEIQTAERIDPSEALCHYNLGRLYNQMGSYKKAREELETAVRLRPRLAAAYYQLGRLYRRLGLIKESRKAYEQFQKAKAGETKNRPMQDPTESVVIPP